LSDLELLHRKMRLIEKWMLFVDKRQLEILGRIYKLEQQNSYYPTKEEIRNIKIGLTD